MTRDITPKEADSLSNGRLLDDLKFD